MGRKRTRIKRARVDRPYVCALCDADMVGRQCTNPRCERSVLARAGQPVRHGDRIEVDQQTGMMRKEGSNIWIPGR